MSTPIVIVLSGTSSSGKSSIAGALQRIMKQPYLHVTKDCFTAMLPPLKEEWNREDIRNNLLSGFNGCIAALASSGNSVIVDDVLYSPKLAMYVEALADFRAFFVGVHCPLEEIERRERERGDRRVGVARGQFDKVHQHGIYDVEVDTSVASPQECAQQIKDFVESHQPRAFQSLRR